VVDDGSTDDAVGVVTAAKYYGCFAFGRAREAPVPLGSGFACASGGVSAARFSALVPVTLGAPG